MGRFKLWKPRQLKNGIRNRVIRVKKWCDWIPAFAGMTEAILPQFIFRRP